MSDDEANIPDRDTCQKRTEEFASITQTNEALAQTFLQDYEWDLEKSISAFYDALSKENGTHENAKPTTHRFSYDSTSVEQLFGEGMHVTTEPPPQLKFLSWNLDGLDEVNLKKRTRTVINLVKKHEPDIVFFQEVIPETAEYLTRKLPEYKCVCGNDQSYFTMTLLRVFTIFYDKHKIVQFESSQMGRNLLITEAHMGKLKLQLVNTHLESGAEHSEERIRQLKNAFSLCSSFPDDYSVIFGGDLNLRDKESCTPSSFYDVWEACDSPKEFQYTWDMTKNTNHSNFGRFKPRCRFDRIYFRFGKPRIAKPKVFALTGFEKAPLTQSFPSDHWALLVIFQLDHSL